MNIALTGVTGNLGGLIAEKLAQKGIVTRHLARNIAKAKSYSNAQIFETSYENTTKTITALTGVDVLFMVSAKEHPERVKQHQDFIDAAYQAGVKHIIYTSFYNNSATATFTLSRDHYQTEQYILNKGMTYTFVRDNFYLDFFVNLCLDYGEIKGPAQNGKVSAVVREDVADVLVELLQQPNQWENQILNMTGTQELTMQDIVNSVGTYMQKEMHYYNETVEEAYQSRQQWQAEQWEYDSWVSTYTAIATGEQAGISHDIEKVLGRPATTLNAYLERLTQHQFKTH